MVVGQLLFRAEERETKMLSASVMSHPSRARAAADLLESLAPLDPVLAVDPEPEGPPSALAASLLAWGLVPQRASHHLVVQDDAELGPESIAEIRAAIAERPDSVIVFYVGWASASAQLVRARGALPRWGEIVDPYLPAVCVSMPAQLARMIASRPPTSELDDVNLLEAVREVGADVRAYYPSPVDHGALPSLVGNDHQGHRGAVTRGVSRPGGRTLTTRDVESFPVIDRTRDRSGLILRWLRRTTDRAWRVCSVSDGLSDLAVDASEIVYRAAERSLHWANPAGPESSARDLALLWLAAWGTAKEAARTAQRTQTLFDPEIARMNLDSAFAEWVGTAAGAWIPGLIDDAVAAARASGRAG